MPEEGNKFRGLTGRGTHARQRTTSRRQGKETREKKLRNLFFLLRSISVRNSDDDVMNEIEVKQENFADVANGLQQNDHHNPAAAEEDEDEMVVGIDADHINFLTSMASDDDSGEECPPEVAAARRAAGQAEVFGEGDGGDEDGKSAVLSLPVLQQDVHLAQVPNGPSSHAYQRQTVQMRTVRSILRAVRLSQVSHSQVARNDGTGVHLRCMRRSLRH